MRVAVFSDVHGNATALEAVLADITQQDAGQVVFGGDLVFGGPAPEVCAARVQALGIPCVRGNTDEFFAHERRGPGDPLTEWTRARLTPSVRTWVAGLPFEHRIDDLLVVHATPWSISDLIPKDAGHHILRRALTEGRAGVLVYAHIHMGWVGPAPGGGLVVNTGSVGFPFDGDPRASYAVLTRGSAGWTAELRRVPYDLDAAAVFPPDHPAPARWAAMMRTARRG
jgi:diadenosine tetraphosphatase ApaH/serine/threonine PP2A family protein phosphatase